MGSFLKVSGYLKIRNISCIEKCKRLPRIIEIARPYMLGVFWVDKYNSPRIIPRLYKSGDRLFTINLLKLKRYAPIMLLSASNMELKNIIVVRFAKRFVYLI